jgi:hypothetical protein
VDLKADLQVYTFVMIILIEPKIPNLSAQSPIRTNKSFGLGVRKNTGTPMVNIDITKTPLKNNGKLEFVTVVTFL